MTPTDVLNRPAADFWMDEAIRRAGVRFVNDRRKAARGRHTSAGSASAGEKEELVDRQDARARAREEADGNPGLADQLAGLDGGRS